jgi:hypothetical protein
MEGKGKYNYAYAWLGLCNLFQIFEELESVKDKEADIQVVREVLDEESTDNGTEMRSWQYGQF